MSNNQITARLAELKISSKEIQAARLAFFVPGFAISTWAPMIPMVKERLALGADVLGLLLLCIGVSAFVVMPFAGKLGQKWGCQKLLMLTTILLAFGIIVLPCLPNILSYAFALALLGAVMGATEVTMNINAVIVEKLACRRLMSSMHAFWSIGCFASAGLFSLLASWGLAVTSIACLHCAIMLAIIAYTGRHWLPYKAQGGERTFVLPHGIVIIIGVLACISFLVEGAIMDWSGIFLTEAKQLDLSLAGAGYAIFSIAMLIMRLIGDKVVQLLGEQKAVISGTLLAALSFAGLVATNNIYLNALAFILIGVGCSNVVPVFYSALKEQKAMPIGEAVTAVTSLGYTGVILGPALLGFIAHCINISAVFELMSILLLIEVLIAKYVFTKLKI